MAKEKLYCIDCYVPNKKPLKDKCLERCDGHGPVDTASEISRLRKLRRELELMSRPCAKCGNGDLVFPNEWWRDTLKQLRCNWCHHVVSAKNLPCIPNPDMEVSDA